MNKLVVSLSPHAHGTDSVERNMYGVIIALVPALIVSFVYFGLGSAVVCAVSVASCVFLEWAITKYMLRRQPTVSDGSAILTGLLLGFNLPSNIPIWIVMLGAVMAIGVAKMAFGGLGCNLFNPALVGRCFLLVSFPAQMTSWPQVGQLAAFADVQTGATPLSIMKEAIKTGDASMLDQLPDALTMLMGNPANGFGAGTIGEVCALALLIGLVYMLMKRIITWHIPVSIILTVAVMATALHLSSDVYAHPIAVLLSGGLMLGAIFMATAYGIGIGVLTVVIRNWGSYPEGMSFAILIMNAMTPLINNYVKPKRFGVA